MISRFFLFIILILYTIGNSMDLKIKHILPDENDIQGWTIDGSDKIYGPDNLYEYINGGAELFLSYGLREMVTRLYTCPDQPEIIVDVFDMGTSQNAYGVFSYSRETEDTTFGQGSQYAPGLLLFWKNHYYVSILFTPQTEAAKETAFWIARHIESAIPEEGQLPEIIKLLPQQNLLWETIRYFRHHVWLNSYHFVSNENILLIDENTETVLAKYQKDEHRLLLLLIEYPNAVIATDARKNFTANYSTELIISPVFQLDDQWYGYQQLKNFLFIVFNSRNQEQVEFYINDVIKNIEKHHNF